MSLKFDLLPLKAVGAIHNQPAHQVTKIKAPSNTFSCYLVHVVFLYR